MAGKNIRFCSEKLTVTPVLVVSLRLTNWYSSVTMVVTMLLLNILPCVCLTTLNKRIYDVVQIKIKNLVSLNKRKVGAVSQKEGFISLEMNLLVFLIPINI